MDEKMAIGLSGAAEMKTNIDATLFAKSVGSAKWHPAGFRLWPIIRPSSELLGVRS